MTAADQSPEINPVQLPLLNVTRGNPTDEELAAVTAVVLALQSGSSEDAPNEPKRQWARRAQLHLPPRPGAGSWRRSVR
ncbi:acyl-CoA carboxylase subunit epsilon [Arthrobacter psychrochitiniphilus]|uniref:acyl-CoA carboxylase subunit epsilon n=1 Tax=Arthrobacter psychrochitiniphilus TaxID=291045 RepID=UPI003F7C23AC